MKINRSAVDSPIISNTSDTTPKQEAQKATSTANLQSQWDSFVTETAANGGAIDPNALVQHVLKESYVQTTEDLRFFSEKVKYFNQCKKLVRDYVSNLRDYDMKLKEPVDSLIPGNPIDSNVVEKLTSAIKENAKDSNEDKKFILGKLEKLNTLSTDLAQQTRMIEEASRKYAVKKKKDDDD
jgi:hypothetical protein